MGGGRPAFGSVRWRTALIAALAFFSCGQPAASQDSSGIEDVRFRSYGAEHGLSQLTVRAIAQTSQGYIWLGTQDGLDRFDGYGFRIYRHDAADPTSLPDNHVFALAPASDGGLWVAGQTGGLARYDPLRDRFERHQRGEGGDGALASDRVTALHVDRSGTLWLGTREGYVQRSAAAGPRRFETLALVGAREKAGPVRAILERADGSLLVGAEHGLWSCTADGCAQEWRADGASLDVYAIAESRSGEVWIATAVDGLVRFDVGGRALGRLRAGEGGGDGLAGDAARALRFDARGRLWVGTDDGLSRLETVTGPVRTWRHDPAVDDGLASNRVYALFEDREQQLWVGTWLNGVSVFDPRTEAFGGLRADPHDARRLPTAAVRAVAADDDGTVWLGLLEGGGLVQFDPSRGVVARYTHDPERPESLASDNVQYLARTRDGSLWIGTNGGGLDRLREDGTGFEHYAHDPADPNSLGGNGVYHVEVDREGTLWVSLDGAGLDMRCARCSGFRHFRADPDDPHSLAGNTVSTVFESSAGEIWVGLRPGGLARFDRTSKTFESFRAAPGVAGRLSSDSITVIAESRDGTIWVGTQGGGLDRMVRSADGRVSFESITRRDGLGADAIGAILEAEDGRLWLSTTAGLSRYDPATGRIENFNQRQGAQSAGYFIGAAAKLPGGEMLFGGLRGATLVDPSSVAESAPLPPVTITSVRPVRSGTRAVAVVRAVSPETGPSRVELPHELNDFTVEFSAMSFVAPLAVAYDYRLDDYDAGWLRTDASRRSATYTNLPPGDYTFRVRARVNGGEPGPEARVALALAPPWWRSNAALLGWLVLAAGVLALFAMQVRARLRERVRAQRRIRDSEERLKLALWGSGSELWDYDVARGEVRYVQPLGVLELERGETPIPVESLGPHIHPDDLELFTRTLMSEINGEAEHLDVTYRVKKKGGDWLWVRTRGRAVRRNAEGRALRMVGTNDDIDELKEQEASLARLNRELEERVAARTADLSALNDDLKATIGQLRLAQDQLVESEKMAALGGLVAGVAHEINTPLGIGVTAASHLESETRRIAKRLAEGGATREEIEAYHRQAAEATEIILRNLRRADKLVKSFKQVAVDQSSEQKRQLDLCAYLEEVLTSLAPALKRGRHTIEVRCAEPVSIETYPGAIYQIVVNLVMNSVTHAFAGGEQGHITIDVARRDGEVEIDYRDDGAGMPEDVRRRAFEPFFTTRRGQGGSGLGLHIVYNLSTQVLRGRTLLESAPGRGFRFLLRFPA